MPTLLERFLAKTDCGAECWTWLGHKTPEGYGYIQTGRYTPAGHRSPDPAHRVSYELFIGKIPDGLMIDHLCRNPSCVNPDHLEAVTNKENCIRAYALECRNGHPRTPENTYVSPRGSRACRECRMIRGD